MTRRVALSTRATSPHCAGRKLASRLDVGGADHLAPLPGLFGEERAELGWRHRHRHAAEVEDLRLERRRRRARCRRPC